VSILRNSRASGRSVRKLVDHRLEAADRHLLDAHDLGVGAEPRGAVVGRLENELNTLPW